jgi:hypothetical protein
LASAEDRRDPRYRVHLAVRFGVAHDFVVEYAENLCKGGVFVAGAHRLEALQEITLQLALPGYGEFTVVAQVAHVLSVEQAEKKGRKPGAGLAIISAPPEFNDALSSYLLRLGRRADVCVLAVDDACGLVLAAAGYKVKPAPEPSQLAAAIARADAPVIGVVAPRARLSAYERAAAAAGAGNIVVAMDSLDEADAVLTRLDEEL